MGKKLGDPGSAVKTNSLARRMHDGYAKQIAKKARKSNTVISQEDWDLMFGKKDEYKTSEISNSSEKL